jgi:hypothetical protein
MRPSAAKAAATPAIAKSIIVFVCALDTAASAAANGSNSH